MELIIRATAIFWFLWLVVRGTGKRSLAELTPLDLILIVVIGDIVQQGVTQEDMSVTGAIAAVSVFVAWTLAADSLARRFPKVSKVIAGEPIIVVRDGTPLEDRMRRERVTMDDLHEAARIEGIGNLEEVEFAVLETDGEFSFITRSNGS